MTECTAAALQNHQEAYDKAFATLNSALDRAEGILSNQRYLCGDSLTEADIRLFVTLIRFDPVYVLYFKCNAKRIGDYPPFEVCCRHIQPLVLSTVSLDHIVALLHEPPNTEHVCDNSAAAVFCLHTFR